MSEQIKPKVVKKSKYKHKSKSGSGSNHRSKYSGPKVVKKVESNEPPAPISIYGYTYVDMGNVKIPKVLIEPCNGKSDKIKYYSIRYRYHDMMDEYMNVFCPDIKLHHRKGCFDNYGNATLCYDEDNDINHSLETFINLIKSCAIDHLINNVQGIDMMDAQRVKDQRLTIYMMLKHNKKLCKIIKLGSKSENNINTEIKTTDEFNKLISDRRYNRQNTDRFWLANILISFRCLLYKQSPAENWKISFKPYIRLMEVRFNKASCVPVINREEQLVITSNTLSI